MVKSCSAYNCISRFSADNPDIRFHKYPLQNPELLSKWIVATKRKNFIPNSSTFLCTLHFKPEDYNLSLVGGKPILKKDAVPSAFNFPKHLVKPEKQPRRIIQRQPMMEQFMIDNANNSNDEADSTYSPNAQDVAVQTDLTCEKLDSILQNLRRDKKLLQMKLLRRDERVSSMQELITVLKKNESSNELLEDILKNKFPNSLPLELFQNEIKNEVKPKNQYNYSNEIKEFALTLYFYSPKAYIFLRKRSHLPDPATIRRWLASRNCFPGLLTEVLSYLKEKVNSEDGAHLNDVALIFDCMSIRKGQVYDKKNDIHVGYVNYGGIIPLDEEELASEILMFNIVSFTKKYKCPVAYFYVNNPSAMILAQISKCVIAELYSNDITVHSITCDGPSTNFKALELLGCQFSFPHIKPNFPHPSDEKILIHCILDPAHMIKLCRNFFLECTNITSSAGVIDFAYLKKLNEIQEKESLKLGNKLSSAHIKFRKKVMNVSLATQTISASVADALEYMKEINVEFKDAGPTIEFLRIFDRIFDVFNSRNIFGKGYKAPMSVKNLMYLNKIYEETKKYILELKCNNKSILNHGRKRFAQGFLIDIISFNNLGQYLLVDKKLHYFLTYKCSQDHIKLLFSCIRSCNGWNNNPDALKLRYTLRKMLFRNSVQQCSNNANCTDSEGHIIDPCFSLNSNYHNVTVEEQGDIELIEILHLIELSNFTEAVLYFIAGKAVRKYLGKYPCEYCKCILIEEPNDHNYASLKGTYKYFTFLKSNGGLIFSSKFVFDIVCYTEKCFLLLNDQSIKTPNFKSKIVHTVHNYFTSVLHKYPGHRLVDTEMSEDLHESKIIKFIASFYATARICQNCKDLSVKLNAQKNGLRQQLTKLILFSNL